MATWDDVRKLALALPETEESTTYRKPAFKVAGKNFAWESPHVDGALALNCDEGERPLMIVARPEMFFATPHYDGYPIVLVRLEDADAAELAERIEESWLIAAPKNLADAYTPD
jgi:hypothetical protein